MRILLVDDDPKLARALAKGLRAHAYAVDVAAGSGAALLRAAVYAYDVVLLDVMLPGRDAHVCRQGARTIVDSSLPRHVTRA